MILTGGGLYHKINIEIIEGASLSAQVTQQAIIFQPEHLETTPRLQKCGISPHLYWRLSTCFNDWVH